MNSLPRPGLTHNQLGNFALVPLAEAIVDPCNTSTIRWKATPEDPIERVSIRLQRLGAVLPVEELEAHLVGDPAIVTTVDGRKYAVSAGEVVELPEIDRNKPTAGFGEPDPSTRLHGWSKLRGSAGVGAPIVIGRPLQAAARSRSNPNLSPVVSFSIGGAVLTSDPLRTGIVQHEIAGLIAETSDVSKGANLMGQATRHLDRARGVFAREAILRQQAAAAVTGQVVRR